MTPYFQNELVTIYHGDCVDIMDGLSGVVVTDPPYNRGYHYIGAGDSRSDDDYSELLRCALRVPSVVVCYPELSYRISWLIEEIPSRVAAWCYPANTHRNWRSVAWFGVKGEPERVRQPYKNPKDKRIMERVARGEMARGYDWKVIPQTKNVSREKTVHPCQNPVEVMEWVLASTPDVSVVIDPFAGSGTTLVAAANLGLRSIGVESVEEYCEIAAKRLNRRVV